METAITISTVPVSEREPVQEVLYQAAQLALALSQRHDYKDIHRRAQDLAGRLGDSVLNVTVLGEFKRGKSSLINALLGAKVLPTAVIPTTSIVTAVKFGSVPRTHVKFEDGREFYILPDKINEYITEDLNAHNQKGVRQVEVEYPSALLSQNIRLIDTPGIGSIHLHNTQTTRAFLEEADAVLFVFSADQPATEAELSLLKEVSAFSVRTFLVQNKADQLSQDELKASGDFLTRTIAQEFQDKETNVYAVSARRALDAAGSENLFDFDRLRADFETFAAQGRKKAFAEGATGHLKHMLVKIEQQIQMDAALLSVSRSKLEEAVMMLESAAKDIALSQELSAGYWIKQEFKELTDRLQKKLQRFCAEQQPAISRKADEVCSGHTTSGIAPAMQHCVQEVLEQWGRQAEQEISAGFAAITARFYSKAKTIAIPINELVNELLQIELHFDFEPTNTSFVIDYKVIVSNSLLQRFLPVLPPFLKKPIINLQTNAALRLHSRNLIAGIRQQLEKRVQQFVLDFKAQVEKFVSRIHESLTRAVQRQELVVEKLSELKEAMSADLRLIERVRTELDKLQ